ncbi:MAG: peptidylprolyl isomerase [Verrucomicrobiae bacterium]|nr:peptidylprolyl isomerase [Verrucomicrobiae bacterium]
MFIAHGEKVRKHARWILGAILVLLIPGFILLFTETGGRERRAEPLPTLRGKPVPTAEYEQARRAVRDLYCISMGRDLPSTPETLDELRREAVKRLLQLRKAHQLGIRVSQEVLEQWIRSQPLFCNERGQFDPERYRRYLILLNNLRISEARFLELMRDEFILAQLREWVSAGAKVTPQQVQLHYGPTHEKLLIDVVQFDMANNKDPITVTEADAEAYFKQHREAFRRPALVKVRYAFFPISELKKTVKVSDADVDTFYEENRSRYPEVVVLATNVTGNVTNVVSSIDSNALARVKTDIREMLLTLAARRRAAELAQQLAVKVVPDPGAPRPDFVALATNMQAVVKETDFFSQDDPLPGITGRTFHENAFWLARRPDPPFSDAFETPEGCYVLEYLDGKPSRIPDFTEVKQEVIDRLKTERRYDATVQQGRDALAKVNKLMAEGKSFSNACAELQLKIETYGPFTADDRDFAAPAASRIQQACLGLPVGAVSEFITTATGGLFFHLRDRKPPEPAAFEADRARTTQMLLARARNAFYENWVESLLHEEQVDFGRSRPVTPPPPVEEEPTAPQPAPAPPPPTS